MSLTDLTQVVKNSYSNHDVAESVISGVRVIVPALASRPFVSLPSRKNGAEWAPIITILSPTVNEQISVAVLAAYRGAK